MITDCHIHIQPLHMFRPEALELMKKRRPNFEQIAEFTRSPKSFLKYLDAAGVDRAVLINYVAPDVIGFSSEVNQFVADYVKTDSKRLIPCGGIHPRHGLRRSRPRSRQSPARARCRLRRCRRPLTSFDWGC